MLAALLVLGSTSVARAAGSAVDVEGAVTYVADDDAFVNVGRLQGLSVGTQLQLRRRSRAIGACNVVDVSDRRATCRGERVRFARGDQFVIALSPPDEPDAANANKVDVDVDITDDLGQARPRPRRRGEEEQLATNALRERVQAVELPVIPSKKAPPGAVVIDRRVRAVLRQQGWVSSSTPAGAFARTSLDVQGRGALVGEALPHVFGAAAVRVTGDLLAPADQRMRRGEPVELYVHGASVGVDRGVITGQVGRFYGRRLPGLSLLDGAQLGVRLLNDRLEFGAYGGTVPDLITTAPSTGHLVGGVYVGADVIPIASFMVLPRLRVGVDARPDLATVRAAVEAQNDIFVGNVARLGASVRAGFAADDGFSPVVDAARVDGDLRLSQAVRASAGYRYLAPLAVDFDRSPLVPVVGGAHNGDVTIVSMPLPWLSVGATGGVGYDVLDDSTRSYVGPEIGLPHALGDLGGLTFSYQEEIGEWAGRSGSVGAVVRPIPLLQLTSRLSYFELDAQGDSYREVALTTFTDLPVLSWLTINGRLYVQQALPPLDKSSRSVPTIVNVDVAGVARF